MQARLPPPTLPLTTVNADHAGLGTLYALLADVYATSDHMSDDFVTRYPDEAALAGELAAVLARPGGLVLVAGPAAMPDAYVIVEPRPQARLRHTADLSMGVRSAARGRGIGHALIHAALEKLAAAGIVEIVYLMVRADHSAARQLYASAGFECLATLERDTRIGDRYCDGVLMRRFVASAR